MKKLKIFAVLLACLASVSMDSYAETYGATNDAITNACYEIKGSRCGARNYMKPIGAVVGATAGAAFGAIIPVPLPTGMGIRFVSGGPVMTTVGGVLGAIAGAKIGAKINYKANEYLYFDNDTCLECDEHQMGENYECPNGTIVMDGEHVVKCQTRTFGDQWMEYQIPFCSNSALKNENGVDGAVLDIQSTVNKTLSSVPGVYVLSGDVCYVMYCPDGTNLNAAGTKCVEFNRNCETESGNLLATGETAAIQCDKDASNIFGKLAYGGALTSLSHVVKGDMSKCIATCKNDGWDITLKDDSSCEGEYKPNTARKACVGEEKPTPVIPTPNNGGNTPVVPNPDNGGQTPVTTVWSCPGDKIAMLESWRIEHYSDKGIVSAIDALLLYCANDASRNIYDFTNRYNAIEAMVAAAIEAANAEISQTVQELEDIFGSMGVSVWKNKEGNFNTARLASDSIAGVVLGTAGGLITSKVVKKNQIKSGFEDISCTIGGQRVADWSDEFTVGVK